MKNFILFLLLTLSGHFLQSQSGTLPPDSKLSGDAALLFQGGTFMVNNNKGGEKHIEGHPYLNEEWQKGWIYLQDGKRIDDETELLVNNFNDLLHIKLKTIRAFNASVEKIDSIHLKNNGAWEKLISLPIKKVEKEEMDGHRLYQVMLEEENVLLLKHDKKIYKVADNADTYGGIKNAYDKYVAKTVYFIQIDDDFTEIKLKLKDLKKVFPKEKDQISRLIKKHSLNTNKQGDFLELLRLLVR